MAERIEEATLAGGCFWCLEAVFQEVEGVQSAQSGYSVLFWNRKAASVEMT